MTCLFCILTIAERTLVVLPCVFCVLVYQYIRVPLYSACPAVTMPFVDTPKKNIKNDTQSAASSLFFKNSIICSVFQLSMRTDSCALPLDSTMRGGAPHRSTTRKPCIDEAVFLMNSWTCGIDDNR